MIQPLKKMVYFQACDGRNGLVFSSDKTSKLHINFTKPSDA